MFKIKEENDLPDSSSSDELQGKLRIPLEVLIFLSTSVIFQYLYRYLAVVEIC